MSVIYKDQSPPGFGLNSDCLPRLFEAIDGVTTFPTYDKPDPGRRWFVVQRNFAGVYIRGEELESMLSKG